MALVSTALALPIEWAVAGRPIAGEVESGDLHVVEPFEGGVLVGVIDGLGHGPAAAQAARDAAALIRTMPAEPVDTIIRRCHDDQRGARGVVLSLASFRQGPAQLSFCGIGNVDGLLLRARGAELQRQALPSRGGVVGSHMPSPRVETFALVVGDVVLLTTDGIRQGYAAELDLSADTAALATTICERYARPTDDALVVALRWLG